MAARAEITTKYAEACRRATTKCEGTVCDEVVAIIGWPRDNARRRLTSAATHPPGPGRQVAQRPRKPRARNFSDDAVRVLERVWAISGGQCGRYLHTILRILLNLLETYNELVYGQGRDTTRAKDTINVISRTKPGSLLRSAITVRRAGDEVEADPRFFEDDTVAHCGPVETGVLDRALELTDFHTGWTFTRTVGNNAHANILAGSKTAAHEIPFQITGLGVDNWCDLRQVGRFSSGIQPELRLDSSYNNYHCACSPLRVNTRSWAWALPAKRFSTDHPDPVAAGTDRGVRREPERV